MGRMFQVLGFWTLAMALMFLAGELYIPAILFFVQTALFIILGLLNLTEKTYMYLFAAYMFIAFCGMVWYATFMMDVPAAHAPTH
ncbi:DUF2626 family protein [Thermoflavimicrobium dichotomicum]|uniref:DUF2626 domain-containing protein n=1 Tax=Thermoflavimicrobium dichotomicum TaxID=46223 RepID=A0A1I3N7M9_9BACL|nr:DUF2626 family protein [Thermoflavimicrobium dichotomicum]SFJ05273.1 Protein of unknown function [Thermoflavimicrobium dichotomicum]